MNFGQPHGVLLFFGRGSEWAAMLYRRRSCLAAHAEYYRALQEQGRVLQYGSLAHGQGVFVLLSVSSDTALETILEHDPALRSHMLEVTQAMPFLPEDGSAVMMSIC